MKTRHHPARLQGIAPLLVVLACGRSAFAQGTAAAPAGAPELFNDAVALAAEHRFAEACPKFAESQRLAPQLDTLLGLAECYEQDQRLESAHATYRAAAELAGKQADPREASAKQHQNDLEPRLSRLTIDVPQGSRVPGLHVSRDAVGLEAGGLGVAVPLDGGAHRVTASAAGYETWETDVYLDAERSDVHVSVPPLTRLPTTAAPQGKAALPPARTDEPGTTQRTLGYVGIGVGAVGLLTGVVFSLRRQGLLDDQAAICPGDVCPAGELEESQKKVDDLNAQARTATTNMAISFAVGGVAVAGGVLLLLTVPEPGAPAKTLRFQPVVGRDYGGLSVRGGF